MVLCISSQSPDLDVTKQEIKSTHGKKGQFGESISKVEVRKNKKTNARWHF